LRWARLRRATFPPFYFPELLGGMLPPLLALAVLAATGTLGWGWIAALPAFWYAAEAVLAAVAGWPLSWRAPAAWLIRDCLLPVLWAAGWGRSFVWRGNAMATAPAAIATTASLGQ
jgi:ceramide glucosyltransferase